MRMLLAGLVLAGCATVEQPERLEIANLAVESERVFAEGFLAIPFAEGPVSVVTAEPDRMRTYRLVPCQGGTRICAGGPRGPQGVLTLTPDYRVVTGLYGRTFYLSPGGNGAVYRNGVYAPLAWD